MDLLQKANLLNKGYHLFTDNFCIIVVAFAEHEIELCAKHFSVPLERAGAIATEVVSEWSLLKRQVY